MITKIESVDPAPLPLAESDPGRRVYASPDRRWSLVLHGAFEWHMGAIGWKASVSRSGLNLSWRNGSLRGLAGSKGFRAVEEYQPWSFDSGAAALVTWQTENPVHVYDVEGRRALQLQSGPGFPSTVQFAPDIDALLVSDASSCRIVDGRGVNHSRFQWSMVDSDAPFVVWLPGGRFLWLGREVTDESIVIRSYSALDGSVLEAQRLDPDDAVPYDRERYQRISRSTFALRLSSGTWSVGSLLDRWHRIRFDRATGRLLLAVFRPVSEPYDDRPGQVCDVEERWVATTLVSA